MKAFVTSIGESTRDLCLWSLARNGFEPILIENGGLLVDKLQKVYKLADADFVRIDADVVVNQNFKPDYLQSLALDDAWWVQFKTYDWLKQDLSYGGVQFYKKAALKALRKNVEQYHDADRPETQLSRLPEFHNPRRFITVEKSVGIHGFAINDLERVQRQKSKRKYFATYDFELAERLEDLLR
jgi:hypothetical protein